MKLISFSKLNKYFILPFFVPILSVVANEILIEYNAAYIDNETNKYLFSLYISSSLIVGGLPYFISLIISRRKKKEDIIDKNESSSSIKLIHKYGVHKNYHIKFGLILLMSFLFTVNLFLNRFYFRNYKNIMDSRFYEIVFIIYLSKIILRVELFRHHKFSILLSFIGFIFIFIPIIIKIEGEEILPNILIILKSFLYSLFLALIKYLTCTYFVSPYLCCLLTGIFSTMILIILFMLYSYYFNGDLSGLKNCFHFKDIENKFKFYFFFILSYVIFSSTQFFTYMTIYYFSPLIFLLTQVFFSLIFFIINIFSTSDQIFELLFTSFGYLILFFAILIHHEIIILNFCELNKNTKKCIEERQKNEIEIIDMIRKESDINEDDYDDKLE